MLNRLAERYGMLVARATPPARRLAALRKVLSGNWGEQMEEWQLSRRRDRHLRMTRYALDSLPDADRFRDMAFTFAVVALAAKVAQAHGEAGEEEYAAFRKDFPLLLTEDADTRLLFDSALGDDGDAMVYARQIRQLFPPPEHRRLLKDVVLRLLAVAEADAPVQETERLLLRRVVDEFGVRSRAVERRLRGQEEAPPANPYAVLGVRRSWNDRRIRHAYLTLIREAHPDRVQAEGGSRHAVQAASEAVARVNAAYALICEQRGLKRKPSKGRN